MKNEKYWTLGEAPPQEENDEARKQADDQYPSPAGYLTRLPLYERTPSYQNFFANRTLNNPDLKKHLTDVHFRQVEAMRDAGVKHDATVLILAMGDGADALLWAEEYNHTGRIIGVNLHKIFDYGQWLAKERQYEEVDLNKLHVPMEVIDAERLSSGNKSQVNRPQVKLMSSDVTKLDEIPTSSIDAATLNNFGHHATQETLIRALQEVSRVLKPDGILGFSGRDILNMYKHWNYVPYIARVLEAEDYPETFYSRCTTERAEELLGYIFSPLPKFDYTQVENMQITDTEKKIYIDPFYELIPHIKYPPKVGGNGRVNPSQGEMRNAIDLVVIPEIEDEIRKNGFIADGVAQYFRIVKNSNYKKLMSRE
jgi:ubiquinone/menaquinone biosynthesis C-methylase UbiE